MLNLGNLNLRAIILSTEVIQTTRFIINSAEQIQNNTGSLWRNSQILIPVDLDTAIGCIIWTAPDYIFIAAQSARRPS